MPTYVYKFVETGETIEVQQGFHDATLTEVAHPESGEVRPVKKVFTPVGVTFKGSGFFKTDNRGKKSAAGSASTDAKSDGSSDSKSTDSTSGSTSSESKSDTKSGSSSSESTSKAAKTTTPSAPSSAG